MIWGVIGLIESFAVFVSLLTGSGAGPEPIRLSPADLAQRAEISLEAQDRRTPIVMYHDIVERRGPGSVWFDCTVDEFKHQMALIRERKMTPISLQHLYEHLIGKRQIPQRAIVLTFDDNYQGFYDHAYPVLKEYGWPATIFVHTGFVGRSGPSRPKMSWETLGELIKDPNIGIGSHTVNHPDDLTLLSPSEQRRELRDSKAQLERRLGIPIDFLSYPVGKNDATTRRLTDEAGYKMALTIANGPAEESPTILGVNRYIHTRLEQALDETERAERASAGLFDGALVDQPIETHLARYGRVDLALISGGRPETVTSAYRETVPEFLSRTRAQAGINGAYFPLAAVDASDSRLMGPFKTAGMSRVEPDRETFRWEKLRNRPLLVWGATRMAILPYQPPTMADSVAFARFMPDATDVMLAGAWIVRNGKAQDRDTIDLVAATDAQDARRRAFIGIDWAGRFVIGASRNSCSSADLAVAVAAAGLREAVLLDSGFSTSLVIGRQVLAAGHSRKDRPSRPVPHAVLLRGALAQTSKIAEHAENPASLQGDRD